MAQFKKHHIWGDDAPVETISYQILRRRPTGRLIRTVQRSLPEVTARRLKGEPMRTAAEGLRRVFAELKSRGIDYGPFRLP